MIWKIFVVLFVALCEEVHGEDAVSEQRVTIHHRKDDRSGSPAQIGLNNSGPQEEYAQAYPSYEFSYKVNDPETHDIKGQHETREGPEVTGNYWLIEPSGRKRTVNYQANDDIGFNAQIAYTASLKKEETEHSGIDQESELEQGEMEKSNDDNIETNVNEEDQNIENNTDTRTNGDITEQPNIEENNSDEQNNLDNQEDEANNIDNIERGNFDGAERVNLNQGSRKASPGVSVHNEIFGNENIVTNNQENKSRNLNKSRGGNGTNNDLSNNLEKGKRGKARRNKHQFQIPLSNINEINNSRQRNNKRPDNIKLNDNSNRVVTKSQQSSREKNLSDLEYKNSDSGGIKNYVNTKIRQIKTDQDQNSIRKAKNNTNRQNDDQNIDNFAIINRASSDDKILRKFDHSNISDNSEIYEHSIRIYHPKFNTLKEEEHRKH